MSLSRESVLAALAEIGAPGQSAPAGAEGGGAAPVRTDIVAAGMVRALNVQDNRVRFVLEGAASHAESLAQIKQAAEVRLRDLGALDVAIVTTAHTPKAPPDLSPKPARQGPKPVPGVSSIIAVASGKGGVGKSTLTANLAAALVAEGKRVGLLDADVYGPSQPRMLGVAGRPSSPDGKTILPMRNHGITMMSIGLMTREDEAVIWRGPMLMGALQQMLAQVQWGALDVLLVDLPPGTGDVGMTLAQKAQVTGAIVISTPQDIALLDARKGINMFQKLQVPILGLVENMSTHICSKCGHEEHMFGSGGVAEEAKKLGVPLLAEIPLHIEIRKAADGGAPVVVSRPDSAEARPFRDLARNLVTSAVI